MFVGSYEHGKNLVLKKEKLLLYLLPQVNGQACVWVHPSD
jgi:hypothetical protein